MSKIQVKMIFKKVSKMTKDGESWDLEKIRTKNKNSCFSRNRYADIVGPMTSYRNRDED